MELRSPSIEASQGNGPSMMSLWPVLSSLVKIMIIIVTLTLNMIMKVTSAISMTIMIEMCDTCQQRRCQPQAKFQPRQASDQPGQIIKQSLSVIKIVVVCYGLSCFVCDQDAEQYDSKIAIVMIVIRQASSRPGQIIICDPQSKLIATLIKYCDCDGDQRLSDQSFVIGMIIGDLPPTPQGSPSRQGCGSPGAKKG